jgi:hypothetical protein
MPPTKRKGLSAKTIAKHISAETFCAIASSEPRTFFHAIPNNIKRRVILEVSGFEDRFKRLKPEEFNRVKADAVYAIWQAKMERAISKSIIVAHASDRSGWFDLTMPLASDWTITISEHPFRMVLTYPRGTWTYNLTWSAKYRAWKTNVCRLDVYDNRIHAVMANMQFKAFALFTLRRPIAGFDRNLMPMIREYL